MNSRDKATEAMIKVQDAVFDVRNHHIEDLNLVERVYLGTVIDTIQAMVRIR